MKFQIVLVWLAAAVSATAPPTCKGSSQSHCKYVSSRDANECHRRFAKNHINVATCQAPARTITLTRTKCAVTRLTTKTVAPPPKTTKIYRTITKTGKPTTPPTITRTATSTKIETTIETDTSTITENLTATVAEINHLTDTETVTNTVSTTTTVPFSDPGHCQKRKRAHGDKLPTKCSCFLTATESAATSTATATKKKAAVTHTIYQAGGSPEVIRQTVTVTSYVGGATLRAPETTTTLTATITQTDHTLTIVTDSQTATETKIEDATETVTETETETATATATQHPCDDVASSAPIPQAIYGPQIQITMRADARGPDGVKSCCQACYGSPNCVFFSIGNSICEVYRSVPNFSDFCSSDMCPRGFPNLSLGGPDGKGYYLGPCLRSAVA